MATATRNELFEVSADSIDLFGLHGGRSNEFWIIGLTASAESQSYLLTAIPPTSVLDDVLALIQQDVVAGHYSDIKSVALGARLAVILFLEGVIKPEHFHSAEVGSWDTDGVTLTYIRLPSVPFGMHTFPVHIFSEWEVGSNYLATLDENMDVI
ncbi:hypothetical protein KA078_00530 [Candidatus Woesebacteria bacterium]|nr:hypothetical protein [Candidatus Woesebacteria bacterium]